MDVQAAFKRVNLFTKKYPNLTKVEIKELRDLMRNLSVECTSLLFDWKDQTLKSVKGGGIVGSENNNVLVDIQKEVIPISICANSKCEKPIYLGDKVWKKGKDLYCHLSCFAKTIEK